MELTVSVTFGCQIGVFDKLDGVYNHCKDFLPVAGVGALRLRSPRAPESNSCSS